MPPRCFARGNAHSHQYIFLLNLNVAAIKLSLLKSLSTLYSGREGHKFLQIICQPCHMIELNGRMHSINDGGAWASEIAIVYNTAHTDPWMLRRDAPELNRGNDERAQNR